MPMPDHVLAIDQGTTSTRAILFDSEARPVAVAQRELRQQYPQAGWVEHDPEGIWRDVLAVTREALAATDPRRIAGIGITNQRETAILWDRATGDPIHRAIVWQDRRTASDCARLKEEGAEAEVRERTGLLLDPYFSATKIAWILDHVPGARQRAERGELAFGTVDSFLLWRLTGGSVHATDVTNASRTSLFDIRKLGWDAELCRLFRVPEALLPQVHGNSRVFGVTAPGLFDMQLPIAGIVGDQQAALFGQACFKRGMGKSTYGTGCFMLLNTGAQPVWSQHRLLTTPAYQVGGQTHYALEGSIFVAGAAVKWLRDGLGVISEAAETEGMATGLGDNGGVYMVPAFAGLGAPHWDAGARGAIHGLTLSSTRAHLARAALESVAYQTRDLMEAMQSDGAGEGRTLRVDGGMTDNSWMCQFLADILDFTVERSAVLETTALGAAFHAGLATSVWPDLEALRRLSGTGQSFRPDMDPERRKLLLDGWRSALERTLCD